MFVTVCQQRTSTVPKNSGTCGTKKYRKGDGTGTVERKMVLRCRGSIVVPCNTKYLFWIGLVWWRWPKKETAHSVW